MIRKRVLPRALFIIFVVSFTSFLLLNINTVSADFTEKLIVELDKPDAYPSQDVTITISYMATFPSDESYEMEDSIIYMTVTTSGLVADIETTDYLLNQYVGKPVISGYKYKACELAIHIPDDHGNYGTEEKTYDVTIDNLRDYCNVVQLTVHDVQEEISINCDTTQAALGDNVSYTIKYNLVDPAGITLTRPLNVLTVDSSGLIDSYTPLFTFPGTVTGGNEITLFSGQLTIPADAEAQNYDIQVTASPPSLLSSPVTLTVKQPTPQPDPQPDPQPQPEPQPQPQPEPEPDPQQESDPPPGGQMVSWDQLILLLGLSGVAATGLYEVRRRRRDEGVNGEPLNLPEEILPPGNLIASADPDQKNILLQLYEDSGLRWFINGIRKRHTKEARKAALENDEKSRQGINALKKRPSVFGPGSFRKTGLYWALNKHKSEEKVGQMILRELERANTKEWGKFMIQSLKTLDKIGTSFTEGGTSDVPDSRFKVPVSTRDLKAFKGHDEPLKQFARRIGKNVIRDHSNIADAVVDKIQPDTYYIIELIEQTLYRNDGLMNKAQQIFQDRYGVKPNSNNPQHVKNWVKIMKKLQN